MAELPFLFPVETVETHGCRISVRRVRGPVATELFVHCQPPAAFDEAGLQAEAIYRAMARLLESERGGFASVVSETLLLRSLPEVIAHVRDARRRVLAEHDAATHRPAVTEIGQSPLDESAWLEVMAHAVVPHTASMRLDTVQTDAVCSCAECAGAHGVVLHLSDDETQFHAGGLCGAGRDAYEQTLGMFGLAEKLLQQAGMEFRDVTRTWIYLRHMERDYPQLNRARREFFAAGGIRPAPASTGIYGSPVSAMHDLCLGVYAVRPSGRPLLRTVMTSPTLNEAAEYGADFVRGMRIEEANKVALHVSGTASIDEQGRTAHVGDFDAQADRMLVNIKALLGRQGASYRDVVSAITYLKHPEDAPRLRDKLRAGGFAGFPHALVAAEVCRPDLLCETEVLAVLPAAAR